MIKVETMLDVADNSGAKKVLCFRILGGSKRKSASVGDIIVVSIKYLLPYSNFKNGDVHRAVIVRTRKEVRRHRFFRLPNFDNGRAAGAGKMLLRGSRVSRRPAM